MSRRARERRGGRRAGSGGTGGGGGGFKGLARPGPRGGVGEGGARRLGSEGHPFPTIVASGPRTALPHARSSRRTVAAGDWLLLDFGAQVDGYCADITRTVVVGARATERQRTLYALVEEAQRRARAGGGGGGAGGGGEGPARRPRPAAGVCGAFGHLPWP